jgi:hypothetical protein
VLLVDELLLVDVELELDVVELDVVELDVDDDVDELEVVELVVVDAPANVMWCSEKNWPLSVSATTLQATWRQLTWTNSFWALTPVNVLVTVADWLKLPLLSLVKRAMGLAEQVSKPVPSAVHSNTLPETFEPNPAPVTVIAAGLARLSPSLGLTLSVTLGLPPGGDSGAATAVLTAQTLTRTNSPMAALSRALWRGFLPGRTARDIEASSGLRKIPTR